MTFDDPSTQQYLSTKDIVVLATINPDGAPLITPMWFLHDPSSIVIISVDGLQKIRNLRRDPGCTSWPRVAPAATSEASRSAAAPSS